MPNCCRTLNPVFTEEDIDRISAPKNMTRDEFIAAYLEPGQEQGRYQTRAKPCPFLGDDSRCTIYDVRPEKCRGYPFTDQPDFVFSTMNHANNAVVCPAVFYLVEQMKKRFRR